MNNNREKIMTRFTLAALVLVGALFLWSILTVVKSSSVVSGWKFDVLTGMPIRIGSVAVLMLTALILWSFHKQLRPFTGANIKRLKGIAVVMILMESTEYALNFVLNHFRPLSL